MATTSGDTLSADASRLRLAVARTARRLRQEAGTGLTATQTAALATIERHGPIGPSRLAELERIKRPTATRVATVLEDAGLIERAPDPNDGRACLLSATTRGRKHLTRLRTRKNAYLARRLRDLDESDRAALRRATDVLERMLEEERP
jgi:DNA-binding MarR family transcriptional regulator